MFLVPESWLLFFALAAILPVSLYKIGDFLFRAATQGSSGKQVRRHLGSLSLLFSALFLILAAANVGVEIPRLTGLLVLIAVATGLASVEEFYKLPTQFSMSIRVIIGCLAWSLGLGFTLSESFPPNVPVLIGMVTDLSLTVLFYAGIMYTISLIDSLRGLAAGVVMIVALTLTGLVVQWAGPSMAVMTVLIAGLCLGHLFQLDSDRHLHLGCIGQVLFAVMLASTTATSRTWGPTLTMLFIPLLAVAVPVGERAVHYLARLRAGDEYNIPGHIHGMLLSMGFNRRWVMMFFWILTLLVAVLTRLVYESRSLPLALGVIAALAMTVIFPFACLIRLSELRERFDRTGRLRILFLSHYFYPEVNAPASRLYEHARRWQRAGHKVTVVCPVPSAPHGWPYRGYRNGLWHEEVVEGVRVVRIWTFVAANRGRLRRTMNYVSYMASSVVSLFFLRRHDVIVATSPQFFCGLAGAVATLFRRERFVLEIRDIWPESIAAVGAGKKKILLDAVGALAKWMYSRADHIVTVGEGYREKLLEIGAAPPEKISVVTNGIDFDRFGAPARDGRKVLSEYGLENKFVVSYVGTIGMAHGLDVVLKAAAEMKDHPHVAFMIVGDGAERRRLEDDARRRKLDNVVFTGLLPKEKVPGLLAASGASLVHLRATDLFRTVLPSKLFEGMALGVPIILGVRGHAEAVLTSSGGGLVIEPESADELRTATLKLVEDPELCRRLGQAGQLFARTKFNRDVLAADYAEILEAVARPRRRQPDDEASEGRPVLTGGGGNAHEPGMPPRIFSRSADR